FLENEIKKFSGLKEKDRNDSVEALQAELDSIPNALEIIKLKMEGDLEVPPLKLWRDIQPEFNREATALTEYSAADGALKTLVSANRWLMGDEIYVAA
ncbi:MAG: hypothetical protein V4671_14795, partial [Armatimonadota bacterium]